MGQKTQQSSLTVIYGSFLLALLLTVFPLGTWLNHARPEWVCLVLIYWALYEPMRVGVLSAWCVGLILDGFEGTVLGQNAFAFACVVYICGNVYQRAQMYAVWQMAMLVFVLIGIKQMLSHWFSSIETQAVPSLTFLIPALTSAILWPLLVLILRRISRAQQVYKIL